MRKSSTVPFRSPRMIVLHFLIAFVAQGALASQLRVTHGEPTKPHQFPHQVAIFKKFPLIPESFYCGGSIITPEWILTAGSCVPRVSKLIVKAGKHYINIEESYQQDRQVIKYLVHEDYLKSRSSKKFIPQNDIALLQLESPLVFNHYIKPIALPTYDNIDNDFGEFCGWGSTSQGLFPTYPEELLSIELEILDNFMCADAINSRRFNNELFNNEITQQHICTSYDERGGGPCFYDIGSGFIQHNKDESDNVTTEIVGISSWYKFPCGKNDKPAVFTRVSYYIDWIQAHVNAS